jgi:hypothetical protein
MCTKHPIRREAEAECLGGFEVDHQLEFGWLLDRQIGWLGALVAAARARTPLGAPETPGRPTRQV